MTSQRGEQNFGKDFESAEDFTVLLTMIPGVDHASGIVLKAMYTVTLNVMRIKMIESIHEGDVALESLRSQLKTEFESISSKIEMFMEVYLKSAQHNLTTALVYVAAGDERNAEHWFNTAIANATKAFNVAKSFAEALMATKIIIISTLYVNGYFSAGGRMKTISQLCKTAFENLASSNVTGLKSIMGIEFGGQFAGMSKKAQRQSVLLGLTDLKRCLEDILGETFFVKNSAGQNVSLVDIRYTQYVDKKNKYSIGMLSDRAAMLEGSWFAIVKENKIFIKDLARPDAYNTWAEYASAPCKINCIAVVDSATFDATLYCGCNDGRIRVYGPDCNGRNWGLKAELDFGSSVQDIIIDGVHVYAVGECRYEIKRMVIEGGDFAAFPIDTTIAVTSLAIRGNIAYIGSIAGGVRAVSYTGAKSKVVVHKTGVRNIGVCDDKLFTASAELSATSCEIRIYTLVEPATPCLLTSFRDDFGAAGCLFTYQNRVFATVYNQTWYIEGFLSGKVDGMEGKAAFLVELDLSALRREGVLNTPVYAVCSPAPPAINQLLSCKSILEYLSSLCIDTYASVLPLCTYSPTQPLCAHCVSSRWDCDQWPPLAVSRLPQ
jgi:hypothetical protein